MSGLNRQGIRFLEAYQNAYGEYQKATRLARLAVEETVRDTGSFVHVVSARPKALESLRAKLRRKRYPDPFTAVTDLIGVRVITYYRDDVDPLVKGLRAAFEIDSKNSTDKRLALDLREFGYSSVHLIARTRPSFFTDGNPIAGQNWFEIQVRSILEHAWAEIEHAVVYKSGINQTDSFKRRFASLAGTLELLDNEFLGLRDERSALIDRYIQKYRNKKDQTKSFDVARLLAFLEVSRKGLSWREARNQGQPFAPGLEVSCVEAMKAVGISTPRSLKRVFASSPFRYAVQSFAARNGISPDEVSHFASVVLAVAIKSPRTVQQHFPEIMFDPTIRAMVEKRSNA